MTPKVPFLEAKLPKTYTAKISISSAVERDNFKVDVKGISDVTIDVVRRQELCQIRGKIQKE
ncbi:hypothetical protein BpHYR1_043346 [Brachionus plicatilis]|uniref:Uncharacterized protein n=1 Tax=Brachionus plicatilis TaxID=10195 RepID=A0A3M7QA82_BRAPC|nr:hypothetical protein BpHYR1_043346 [Brachionus plicatilis]